MLLYDQIEKIVSDNFSPSEAEASAFYSTCSLYFITTDRRVMYVDEPQNIDVDYTIAGICFLLDTTLYLVATSKEYQNMGYAKDLLNAIISNHSTLRLNVRVKNAIAIKTYISVGFKIVDTIAGFYNYTDDPDDGYEMVYQSSFFSGWF